MDADLQAAIQRLKRSGINLAPISPQMDREDYLQALGCLHKEWLTHKGLSLIPVQISGRSRNNYYTHAAIKSSIKIKLAQLLEVDPDNPRFVHRIVGQYWNSSFNWPTDSLSLEQSVEIGLANFPVFHLGALLILKKEEKNPLKTFGLVAFNAYHRPLTGSSGNFVYTVNFGLYTFELEPEENFKKKQTKKEAAAEKLKKKKEAEEKALLEQLLQKYGKQ